LDYDGYLAALRRRKAGKYSDRALPIDVDTVLDFIVTLASITCKSPSLYLTWVGSARLRPENYVLRVPFRPDREAAKLKPGRRLDAVHPIKLQGKLMGRFQVPSRSHIVWTVSI
jgi:hypothetical protein